MIDLFEVMATSEFSVVLFIVLLRRFWSRVWFS
jgi:hypothetical protein